MRIWVTPLWVNDVWSAPLDPIEIDFRLAFAGVSMLDYMKPVTSSFTDMFMLLSLYYAVSVLIKTKLLLIETESFEDYT